MSFTLQGTGVSGGIAIGRAHLISHAHLEVSHYTLPQKMIPTEIERFDASITATCHGTALMSESTPPTMRPSAVSNSSSTEETTARSGPQAVSVAIPITIASRLMKSVLSKSRAALNHAILRDRGISRRG